MNLSEYLDEARVRLNGEDYNLLLERNIWSSYDDDSMERIFGIIEVLNKTYGDQWSFEVNSLGTSDKFSHVPVPDKFTYYNYPFQIENFSLILKHPDFTIVNSQGNTHHIKGFYTKINFQYNESLLLSGNSVYGIRDYITIEEIMSHYRHSHLTGVRKEARESWQSFCKGSGQIIDQTASMLKHEETFSLESFQIYLYHIRELIVWESLEGTPYCSISGIGVYSDGRLYARNHNPKYQALRIISEIDSGTSQIDYSKLNYRFVDGRLEVKKNEALELELMKGLPEEFHCKKSLQGTYSYKGSTEDTPQSVMDRKQGEKLPFKFRGDDVLLEVTGEKFTVVEDEKFYPTPSITDNVWKYLCRKASQRWFIKQEVGKITGDTVTGRDTDKAESRVQESMQLSLWESS